MNDLAHDAAIFSSKLGASLLIASAFWLGGSLASRLLQRVGKNSDPARQDILNLIGQIAKISLFIFGGVTALGTLGVNISALVAGLGLTGFALGFAFRDALSNLLAGILILLYRPFGRGDHVAVAGFEGTVVGIDLRYTTLHGEERTYLIPNSTLFTNAIGLKQNTDSPGKNHGLESNSPPTADCIHR